MTSQCSATIYDPAGWGHNHRCSRNSKIEEDGKWWCKQHAPSAVKARQVASAQQWKRDSQERMTPHNEAKRLRAVNAKLLEGLGGGIAMVKNINTILGNDEDTSFGLSWLKEAEAIYAEAIEEARK